jgi:hypothetical protein
MPPNDDYAMASVALDAAKASGAPKVAVGYWNRALSAFKEGEDLYEQRSYGPAQAAFIRARQNAERAENSARLQRLRSGEVF